MFKLKNLPVHFDFKLTFYNQLSESFFSIMLYSTFGVTYGWHFSDSYTHKKLYVTTSN